MTTPSKSSEWRDSLKDSKLPRSVVVSSLSSSRPGKTSPMSPNSWLMNRERLSTSKTEPTETPSSKPKSQPEKDSNYIKEPLTTVSSFSVVELWTKTPLPRKSWFATSNPSSQSTFQFTTATLNSIWKIWRNNYWSQSLHSGLSSLTVRELFMLLSKEMRKKFWTNSQLSSQKSITKEVSHQSDSHVSDSKKDTTTWERSVK